MATTVADPEHRVADGRLRVELDAYGCLWLRVRR
jgi:hypothetical protein